MSSIKSRITPIDTRDLFVGTVATIFGVIFLTASIRNRGWAFQLTIIKAIATRFGKRPERFCVGLIGAGLLLVGIYLIATSRIPAPN
ncbi:MAG: hypothetical protein GY880_14145 [Planctomycetaceae bacterium]|nr:hypothetical protein [Planctomycetaceae bacterium]MCP4775372.1 hypothetical protein [Planctomycetaceae bacterium]